MVPGGARATAVRTTKEVPRGRMPPPMAPGRAALKLKCNHIIRESTFPQINYLQTHVGVAGGAAGGAAGGCGGGGLAGAVAICKSPKTSAATSPFLT